MKELAQTILSYINKGKLPPDVIDALQPVLALISKHEADNFFDESGMTVSALENRERLILEFFDEIIYPLPMDIVDDLEFDEYIKYIDNQQAIIDWLIANFDVLKQILGDDFKYVNYIACKKMQYRHLGLTEILYKLLQLKLINGLKTNKNFIYLCNQLTPKVY